MVHGWLHSSQLVTWPMAGYTVHGWLNLQLQKEPQIGLTVNYTWITPMLFKGQPKLVNIILNQRKNKSQGFLNKALLKGSSWPFLYPSPGTMTHTKQECDKHLMSELVNTSTEVAMEEAGIKCFRAQFSTQSRRRVGQGNRRRPEKAEIMVILSRHTNLCTIQKRKKKTHFCVVHKHLQYLLLCARRCAELQVHRNKQDMVPSLKVFSV